MRKRKWSKLAIAMAVGAALVAANASAGRITLYEDPVFKGQSIVTSDTLWNLQRSALRDVAASLVVNDGTWEACTETGFRGRCAELTPGNYARIDRQLGRIASVRDVTHGPGSARIALRPDGAPPIVAQARDIVTTVPAPDAAPRIVLYQHTSQGTRAVEVATNTDDLDARNFDNRADAALVTDGVWRLCDGRFGRGTCADFSPGRYESLGSLDGRVQSAYLIGTLPVRAEPVATMPAGRLVLYQHPNFAGPTAVVDYGRAPDLDWAHFSNPAASVRIEAGNWLMCSEIGYQGKCRVLGPGNYPALTGVLDSGVSSVRQVLRPQYGAADRYGYR